MTEAPRERKAATERAMARRDRRERHARPTTDRDRPTRPSSTRERRTPKRGRDHGRGPTKQRVLVRRAVAVSVLAAVVALAVAVLWTPLLGVRSVDVAGTRILTSAEVVAAAQVPSGMSMLRLDIGGIEARVHRLPRVAQVAVVREWPGTVRIDVTERDPVAFLVASNGVHLVDSTGLDYATVATPPPGLPKLLLTTVSPTDQRTQAVVGVLAALPAQLRTLVLTVDAKTPGSVTLGLTGGRTIRWGSADDSARKAAVLAALMTQPGKVYDVSSPELPTVS